MPKETFTDKFHGQISGRWNEGVNSPAGEGAIEGEGMVRDRMVYQDFGVVLASSPLGNAPQGGSVDDSIFISQDVNLAMVTPGTLAVEVVFRNNGSSTWTAGAGYQLVEISPTGWGISPVAVIGSILPGQDMDFNFLITAPGTPGLYEFQWRMDKSGAPFGEFSLNIFIDVNGAGVGFALNTTLPGGVPPNPVTYNHRIVLYSDAGGTIVEQISDLKATSANCPLTVAQRISFDFVVPVVFEVAKLFREFAPCSVAPGVSDTTGVVDTFPGTGTPVGTTFFMEDRGQIGDGTSVPAAKGKSIVILPGGQQLANVIDGELVDGTAPGSQLIDGEVVFDFVDPNFPFNVELLPAADVPRAPFGVLFGSSSFVRIIGIDGWGSIVGERINFADGIQTGSKFSYKRISKIIIETPSAGTLFVGFGQALGLKYPMKTPTLDTSALTGPNRGYPYKFLLDGELSPSPPERLIAYPVVHDPRGVWFPVTPPNGIIRHELAYTADRTDSFTNRLFDQELAAGNIVIVRE